MFFRGFGQADLSTMDGQVMSRGRDINPPGPDLLPIPWKLDNSIPDAPVENFGQDTAWPYVHGDEDHSRIRELPH